MKVNRSSDLAMDCPSPECRKNIQDSSSRNPCGHHWTSATNDLEMDQCCSSIRPGHNKSLAKVTEDGSKCPYRGKHSPDYTWRTDDCVSLPNDSMVEDSIFNSVNNPQTGYNSDYYDSEQDEICISVHPEVSNAPGSRQEEAALRMYREHIEETFDSVDRFTSVQDSGAVFLNSNDNFTSDFSNLGLAAEQHPVSSFCDSGISYKATTSTSSQGFPPAWHGANANATKHRSRGAVFAGGTLSPLSTTVQQNMSKLSLCVSSPSAKPSAVETTTISATEKKPDTVGSSEDHQLLAKRLKCSGKQYPFDFQELLQTTNDISSYHQQQVQSSNDSRTLGEKSEPCEFWRSLSDQDEEGDTIVHIALILERTDAVINLMDYLTNANDLNIQNHLGQTVLHLAVLLDFDELARMFVLLGAQVAIQDRNGNTPLHLACAKGGDYKTIKALTQPLSTEDRLDSGHAATIVPFQRIPQDPDLRNFEGLTCLHVAAEQSFLTVLNYLIQYCGSDPNVQEYRAGETVLHRAIRDNNLELVRYLLSFEEVDVNARRYDGCTPLQLVTGGEEGVDARGGGGGGKGQQNSELIEHLLVEKGGVVVEIDTAASGGVDFISDNFNAICMDTEFDYDDFVIGGSNIS